MPMQNTVKRFLEQKGLSVYKFIQDTGIAPATGYKLAKKSAYLPSIRVLEVICDTYKIQPGAILVWTECASEETDRGEMDMGEI